MPLMLDPIQCYQSLGVKSLLRQISRDCVVCQRAYARSAAQTMGQLPMERVEYSPPFTICDIDYAGPFLLRQLHSRKPPLIKGYACLFTCFVCRAVQLEVLSDLTTEAFLAALQRFTDCRTCPSIIYTDNGTNFIGANRELKDLLNFLNSKAVQDKIHTYTTAHSIQWRFSPSRSPHFGGLWEAGVKNMKTILKKIIGAQHVTYEQLSTVLVSVEATLNSRPLLPVDSTATDGTIPLTPGHFLYGKPTRSLPSRVDVTTHVSKGRYWELTRRLPQEIWAQWYSIQLQSMQKAEKWQSNHPNIQPGDIVLLKEIDPHQNY